jgi:superfamily II DNA or RNA helicase
MVAASKLGGGLILSATGSGKTFVAGLYLSHLQGTACFIVDELSLLDQAQRELSEVLKEPVGWVGESRFEPQRVTVATIQTLHKHRKRADFLAWYRKLTVVFIDEIHVALNSRNIDVVKLIRPKVVFGLTATLEIQKWPVFLQAVSLAGPVIYTYPLAQGVAEHVLTPGVVCRVMFPAAGLDLPYMTEYKKLIVQSKDRNTCVERIVRAGLHRNRTVILLVERLAHLGIFHRRFQDIPHELIYGARNRQERVDAKRAMDSGELRLIIANKVFGKGVDIRRVDMIVDATAGRSQNNVIQRFGRGVRTVSGKTGLLYFDVSDSDSGCVVKNRFAAAARSRARAYEKAGIKVMKTKWLGDAMTTYNAAENVLKILLASAS